MERPNKSKSLFLKFLPNPSFSPGRDHHHHHHHHSSAYKGFSGPINFSALPDEARTKPKNGESFHVQEPTSPKVSCMGQIKQKHKKKKLIKAAKKASSNNKSQPSISSDDHGGHKIKSKYPKKSTNSAIGRFFSGKSSSKDHHNTIRSSEEHGRNGESSVGDYPSLGHIRKFASGRETLANFDWTAQIAPIDHDHDHDHDRDCYSDEDRRRSTNNSDDDEDDKEIIIPFSAPILMGAGKKEQGLDYKPRKEINIWKRRTMTPPTPLTLNSKVR